MTRPRRRNNWDLIRVVPATSAPVGRRVRDPVDRLQTKAWFRLLKKVSGMSTGDIDTAFCRRTADSESPRLAHKWARGDVSPSSHHVTQLNSRWPGSAEVLDWILWPLLRQAWIGEEYILKTLTNYIHPYGSPETSFYKFPGDSDDMPKATRCRDSTDVDALLNRNDHFGFMAILALVRYAEAARLPQFHMTWGIQLFRAFPAGVRGLGLGDFREEVFGLVMDVVLRRPEVVMEYAIYAEMLFRHIDQPDSEIPGMDFLVPVRRVLGRPLQRDVMLEGARRLYSNLGQSVGILPTVYSSHFI